MAPTPATRPPFDPEADGEADREHHHEGEQVAGGVRHRAADEHRRVVHRQRPQPVDDALAQVLGDADAGERRVEHHGLGEDARHEVLHVGVVGHPRDLDRAAEHVDEQQHEHDRLDGGEDQQLGVAGHGPQVAHRLGPAVAPEPDGPLGHVGPVEVGAGQRHIGRGHQAAPLSSVGDRRRLPRRAWPVSCRNTSSSVGRRATTSTTPMPSASSRRTTVGHDARRCRARARSRVRALAVELGAAAPAAGSGPARRPTRSSSAGSSTATSTRSPPISVLELVGLAPGDDQAVVDDHDLVGQALGLVEVLGGQQRRRALAAQLLDELPHGRAGCAGSRPVVGSSRNSTLGREMRLMAMSSRRRMPPE